MENPSNAASAVLDLILLRTFVEVVDSGSFVLAAERLALTPSTVSGHIKRLENLSMLCCWPVLPAGWN